MDEVEQNTVNHLSVVSRSIICQSQRLRQIVDLQDTDKLGYFVITEFNNNCLSFDHRVYFLRNILGKWSDFPFSHKSDCKKEKTVSRIVFSAKSSWMTLRMSPPLFVGIICRSRGGLSANEKEETFASNDDYYHQKSNITCFFGKLLLRFTSLEQSRRPTNPPFPRQVVPACQITGIDYY